MSRRRPVQQGAALFSVEALTTFPCICGCGTVERLRLDQDVNTCPCLAIFRGNDCQVDQAPAIRGPKREPFTYYLGGRPNWLTGGHVPADVPLFISATTLLRYTSGPASTMGAWDGFAVQTVQRWALDSGAFTALTGKPGSEHKHAWHLNAEDYGAFVVRLLDDMGCRPDFCAPQDWPCEPKVRRRTGLTTRQHIELTVDNFLFLCREFPMVPWMPVIQGWEADDYLYCVELYEAAGVDLASFPRVGIGSICRRANVPSIVKVIELFAGRGFLMHAFGVKTTALPLIGHLLASADSYAWSENARKNNIMHAGCDHRSKPDADGVTVPTDCRNCPRWAVEWRRRVLAKMTPVRLPVQRRPRRELTAAA